MSGGNLCVNGLNIPGSVGGKWMHKHHLDVHEQFICMKYVETSCDEYIYYCTKQVEKCISSYNIFCNDTVLHCVSTDSIINIFIFNAIIEFDNWTTLNTSCGIGCQMIKQVHDFDLSQLTRAMTPVVGKWSCGRQVNSAHTDLCPKSIA